MFSRFSIQTLLRKRIVALLPMLLAGLAMAEDGARRCEPDFVESGIEPFGRIVTWRAGQEIRLPDFRLQVVASSDRKLEFRVRGATDAGRSFVARIGAEPFEFDFEGRYYVLETAYTVLFHRPLAGDEIVVWPRDEHRTERAKWTARRTGGDS